MADALDLMKAIKKGALDAVEESKPVQVCIGTVTSTSPLTIDVEQKETLGEKQLIIAESLTRSTYSVGVRGSEGSSSNIGLYSRLSVNDKVIMLRQQGGQKYVVIDRVG